jgi:hypothetical protein
MPCDRLTDVALVGPDTSPFDVPTWIAEVRARLTLQAGVRIERRLA